MFEIIGLKFKNILDIEHLILDRPVTCIAGASGSGKSTFLKHLNGLLKADEGQILYNGENIENRSLVELRRRVVMLGQSPIIYTGDIAYNLQIGLEFSQRGSATEERLRQSLQMVGLDKSLDDSCLTLSGGEKQRLCLARVLLMEAETYLLDEPSAALDKETEVFMIENLEKFVVEKGKKLIMVTHSEKIAKKYQDSLITMKEGRARGYENA